MRKRLRDTLARMGDGIFGFLSRCEERGRLAGPARWIKLSLLAGVVMLMGAVKMEPEEEYITCYEPIIPPGAYVSDILIDPNPTNGADSLTVTARAVVTDSSEQFTIEKALCQFANDNNPVAMTAVDGAFDSREEMLERRISLQGVKPCTTWLYVTAYTSNNSFGYQWVPVYVTEKDSVEDIPEPDSTGEETE
jgi:hypothetical protein